MSILVGETNQECCPIRLPCCTSLKKSCWRSLYWHWIQYIQMAWIFFPQNNSFIENCYLESEPKFIILSNPSGSTIVHRQDLSIDHEFVSSIARAALAASGHTTSGSGGGLLWHHHHDDEILYCCRRFFRLIKPSRDWRAGVPKCAPETVSCCCYGWCCLLLVLLFNLDHSKNSLDRLSVHLIVSHQMIRLLVNGDGMEAEWWGFIHTQIVMMISGAPRKYRGMGIINIVSISTYILIPIHSFSRVAKNM